MSHNTKSLALWVSIVVSLLVGSLAYGQSLGDYARQQRAKKAQEKAGTAKPRVFTNEDLPKTGGLSTSEAPAKTDQDKTKEGAEGKAGEKSAAAKSGEAKAPSPAEEKAKLEKEYHDKFLKLQDQLATEEKKLDVLQRELNLAQVQYYSNPDQALREQTQRTEINTRTAELDKQRATVEAAKKAIEDLQEEARTKGVPPGAVR